MSRRVGGEDHSSTMHSDIKVIVRFKEQSVFAGEDVQCTITFKNIAHLRSTDNIEAKGDRQVREGGGKLLPVTRRLATREGLKLENVRLAAINKTTQNRSGTHKATASLNITGLPGMETRLASLARNNENHVNAIQKHPRSVSIVSLNSPSIDSSKTPFPQRTRPNAVHQRAMSVQSLSLGHDETIRISSIGESNH